MDRFDRYVGKVFDRRYKIIKMIGVGGMAVVFEAVDMVMHRNVAVKMLKDDIANDSQAVRRFINESKAVSMLSHPNIVSIYDVSVRENIKYIVMELVDGITLKNYMTKKGMLSLRETLSITEQVLRALEHAHSKGIIHRDIKPQNIMVLKNGRIKVTDFGIAKLPNAETVTMSDKAIGTVYYISPEQASGKPIDPRSDLYSLGVMLYEMSTGRLPFVADSPVSVALMQVNNAPRRPREINSSIPIGLEQIILAAMEKNPERRLQTAGQMLRYLEQIQSNPNFVFRAKKPGEITTGNAISHVQQNTQRTAHKKKGKKLPAAPKQKRRSHSMLPIVAGITAAFLVVLGISAVYAITRFLDTEAANSPQTVKIPSLVGQTMSEELRSELESYRYYHIEIVQTYDDSAAENVIIRQEPQAGESRKAQAGKQYIDLTIYVSRGELTFSMPDVTVMDWREARYMLRDTYGLRVEMVAETHDTMMEGYVFRTEPASGTIVAPGDSVKVYYSTGQKVEYTSVPDFYNRTEKEALSDLVDADLVLGNVTYEYSAEVPAGKIISQSKIAFTEVPKGTTKIHFVVSLGPETFQLANYTNRNKDDVKAALAERSLGCQFEYEYSTVIAEGLTIRTYPLTGSEVSSGDIITVYVSLGKQQTDTPNTDPSGDDLHYMPSLYKLTYEQAAQLLEKYGITIRDISYIYNRNLEEGVICEQSIAEGTKIQPGMTVDISISRTRF